MQLMLDPCLLANSKESSCIFSAEGAFSVNLVATKQPICSISKRSKNLLTPSLWKSLSCLNWLTSYLASEVISNLRHFVLCMSKLVYVGYSVFWNFLESCSYQRRWLIALPFPSATGKADIRAWLSPVFSTCTTELKELWTSSSQQLLLSACCVQVGEGNITQFRRKFSSILLSLSIEFWGYGHFLVLWYLDFIINRMLSDTVLKTPTLLLEGVDHEL